MVRIDNDGRIIRDERPSPPPQMAHGSDGRIIRGERPSPPPQMAHGSDGRIIRGERPPPPPQNLASTQAQVTTATRWTEAAIARITGIVVGVVSALVFIRTVNGDALATTGQMFLAGGIAIFGITLSILAIINAMDAMDEKPGLGIVVGVVVGLVLVIVETFNWWEIVGGRGILFGVGGAVIGKATGYIALRMTVHRGMSAIAVAVLIIGIVLIGPSKIFPATAQTEQTFTVDVQSENGAAKIFQIHYGKKETVISVIRTTGSHQAVSIAEPGEANSFYIKDANSEKTWPLKETRNQDYEEATGVELVFDPFESRSFDLIEGNDTSNTAWHFRNVSATAVTATARVEQTFPVDAQSENGAAKIFQIHYGKKETVISVIRTTGSHKAVGITKPGEANSFYIKDVNSGKTWPLKETRNQDYKEAAGVELVFDPFESRSFDLIEGNDTSNTAWHFRNVSATTGAEQTFTVDAQSENGEAKIFYNGKAVTEVNNLAEASKWISRNARAGGVYTIVLKTDQSAENVSFGYGGKEVTVILTSEGGGKTITRSGNLRRPIITIKGKKTTFTLEDGITLSGTGEVNYDAGSLIKVDTGIFEMNGGIISGGENSGVYVGEKGSFIMNGGAITGNHSQFNGGGVYSFGTFTMTGGAIRENIAGDQGGGVYYSTSTFTMTGGVISGNIATTGGGVYGVIRKSGGFSKSGGIIYGSDAREALANKAQYQGDNGGDAIHLSYGAKMAHYSGFDKTVNEKTNPKLSSKDRSGLGLGWEWDWGW